MTIDEAIQILDDLIKSGEYEGDPYDSVAVKLGIEALKQIKKERFIAHPYCLNPLPGETED